MLNAEQVEWEISAYREKLVATSDRYQSGERANLVAELQRYGDALVCLMEEAPLDQRERIDTLIDRVEALRISCMN